MTAPHTEQAMEEAIELHLIANGYQANSSVAYDKELALFKDQFLEFVKTSQPSEYQRLTGFFGPRTDDELIKRLVQVLERDGVLKVIRKGFEIYGIIIKVVFFSPASGLNPEIQARYEQNILTVTRQLFYSTRTNKSLDLVLSLNGLPLVTLELKTPTTSQGWTVQDAIRQYKEDREPRELLFQFKKRTLVHFAVDPDEVFMTTQLMGRDTFFLPFNQGYENGTGNPPAEGFRTAYLWESVLQKDSLLELLHKFLHLEVETKIKNGLKVTQERMIFPRFHQWDAVRKILSDVLEKGPGTNYLIQHSAGSGKTNTIAWLAHRLSNLHGDNDRPIFHAVVVITDRLVLDKQLQDAIYQFDHKRGVVQQINKKSAQLQKALESNEAKIIITTLQKFGMIVNKVSDLSHKSFAVIVDEAHSSQSGDAAQAVKEVLAAGSLEEAEHIQRQYDDQAQDVEDKIVEELAKRGPQKNLSYFAFTATPKSKTLEMFGRPPAHDMKPAPFHLYSMRQAIEEGFILDVLQNYVTYRAYYKIAKAIEDDPSLEERPAKLAISRFASLHPHNLAQKTAIMIEHFRRVTRRKINGRAKAMLVASSRLHALRYKQAFDQYIHDKRYTNIQTLVAFSGTVIDPDQLSGISYTEPSLNGFGEKELPDRFDTDEYQVLIVANKYQTGFDQPLLHTMFVDKKLAGIQAVQTLSRLNRTCRGKNDTFILDFVNSVEEIGQAFQDYYEITTLGEGTDLNLIFDLKNRLEASQVIWEEDVEALCGVVYTSQGNHAAAALHRYIDPAVERFKLLPSEEQEVFRSTLATFDRVYTFVTQIAPFQSVPIHKFYTYTSLLLRKLPQRGRVNLNLDNEVDLQYYRLQEISRGSIALEKGQSGELKGITEAGTGSQSAKKSPLSTIIEILNKQFATDFTAADQLFFDQVIEDMVENDDIITVARSNTLENFSYAFADVFMSTIINRMGQNDRIFAKLMDEPDFRNVVMAWVMNSVYRKIQEQPSTPPETDPETT